jgi:hypothetical protein
MLLHETIRSLNPEVVSIDGGIAYDVNGVIVEYDKAAVEEAMGVK